MFKGVEFFYSPFFFLYFYVIFYNYVGAVVGFDSGICSVLSAFKMVVSYGNAVGGGYRNTAN